MTAHPGYSSATTWHQDVRYRSFDRPDLVSLWLAQGTETAANGALMAIPEAADWTSTAICSCVPTCPRTAC